MTDRVVSYRVIRFCCVGCQITFAVTFVVFSWFECDRTLTYAASLNLPTAEKRVQATRDVVPSADNSTDTAQIIVHAGNPALLSNLSLKLTPKNPDVCIHCRSESPN